MRRAILLALGFLAVAVAPAAAQEVGKVGVDWLGNDIIVEAIKDPQVDGVTCHVSYFDRSVAALRTHFDLLTAAARMQIA